MGNNRDKGNIRSVVKTAGAFFAWIIGSGFATGQEALRFFSSYGLRSYGAVLIALFGFVALGYLLMAAGFDNKNQGRFNHFNYYCGRKAGNIYTGLATATLMLLIPVLIAGGGATLHEYHGVNLVIGSAIMAAAVLSAYLIGFDKMVRIISSLGPVIIAFSLLVGSITLFKDMGNWDEIRDFESFLTPYQASPHWILSGLLYLGLNFFTGSIYFTQLGSAAASKKEIKYGALLGGVIIVLSIAVVNTAILLNANAIVGLDVPVLYFASKISYILGSVFAIMLVLGIFSSCSIMLWSVCSRFTFKDKMHNNLLAIIITIAAYLVSLLSFGTLIGTIYPMIGYVGLTFIFAVLYKKVTGGQAFCHIKKI